MCGRLYCITLLISSQLGLKQRHLSPHLLKLSRQRERERERECVCVGLKKLRDADLFLLGLKHGPVCALGSCCSSSTVLWKLIHLATSKNWTTIKKEVFGGERLTQESLGEVSSCGSSRSGRLACSLSGPACESCVCWVGVWVGGARG